MKRSKRYHEITKMVEHLREYSPEEGVKLIKDSARARFDETVDIAMRLGVDSRHADQMVRGTVSLPNGTGRTVRIMVLTKGENVEKAKAAGADYTGLEEYIEKIQKGWIDFDVVVASPDVMSLVGRLGKILGTRGLMPNPKSGTVTPDVETAVKEIKAGKIEFKLDKYAIFNNGVGKLSFATQSLVENIQKLLQAIVRAKPASAKGQYIQSLTITSTMGPGIKIDRREIPSV